MASVTWRNIPRNIDVTPDPGKGRERNVEGISPFRGIPDVTPMPRRGVMDQAQARNLAHAIHDMARITLPPDRDGVAYAEYRQTPTMVIRIRDDAPHSARANERRNDHG